MKTFEIIMKVLLTVAALAGLIFVAIKYGDKIVAWCKSLCGCCRNVVDGEAVAPEEAPAEETPAAPADQVAEEDFENC